jgi:hypothetical protein
MRRSTSGFVIRGFGIGFGVIAAVTIAAPPVGAGSHGGGGGGGGSHGGGGGGGGGGGVHVGGGGGSGAHFSAPSFSHAAPAFAHPSMSVGTVHTFSHSVSGTPHSVSGMTFRAAHMSASQRYALASGHWSGHTHSGNWHSHGAAQRLANATRTGHLAGTTGSVAHAALAGTHWQHGDWHHGDWQHHADWHRHRGFFGWAGPLFWPYFYDDLYDCVFWDGPYYDDPFWAYGYGDIYGAMFSPYGYEELSGLAPPRMAYGGGGGPARRGAQGGGASPPQTQWSAMCGDDAREVASLPIDRIGTAVGPDTAQRAALDALANASVQAAQAIKTACPTDVAFTPTGRLDAMERRVDAMVQAVALIRPPLDDFYGLLSDEQKARFNAVGRDNRAPNGPLAAPACGPQAAAIPTWPQAQIEKALRPSEGQRVLLERLRDAGAKAADMLKSACPAETPATPPARLAAVASRLDTLLAAVKEVHAALSDFYGSLSDEQKAQFNGIPPMVQNGQTKG